MEGWQAELKPCESITYLHYLAGGPADGHRLPSQHRYDTCAVNGERYERVGDAVRVDDPADGLKVLNCTDDYMEPVFFRVDMVDMIYRP